jgi:hypothetical protein
VSLVVLVMEGTRGIEFMFGIILSVVVANWVAHHIHHDGVYESELERIGNLYFLRDEPPHRCGCLSNNMHCGSCSQILLCGFRLLVAAACCSYFAVNKDALNQDAVKHYATGLLLACCPAGCTR